MSELLTSAQMRTVEQAAMAAGQGSGLDLMERAGRGAVDAVFEAWPELAQGARRALVICGPGNNGGDGFVIARLLHGRGWHVSLRLFGDPSSLPADARRNHDRWAELGAVEPVDGDLPEVDIVFDSLFGTGLTRPVEGQLAVFQKSLDGRYDDATKRVAVDLPSGLCADSGKVLGCALRADLTVTFHAAKPGQYLAHGPAHCGRVIVKPIGVDATPDGPIARLTEPPHSSVIDKTENAHKYAHGHVLVLSGGPGKTGAARLTARGALRIGAGLVTLGVPPDAAQEVASQITAIMQTTIADAAALGEQLEDDRLNVLALGPGLGTGEAQGALVETALGAGRLTVLDADALTLIGRAPGLFERLHEGCVLTPHAGEFARVFPNIAERLNADPTEGPAYSKIDATRDAAERAGCTVLFKGPDTVIAAPGGRAFVNSAQYARSAPWLGSAGTGDVLAGFVAGLLARGLEPLDAAATAARLHVDCALRFGPGLISEDLPETLPAVLRHLTR
ncbi:NAD(P)H-hydrate dehydratase [Marivita sp. GX14005]|uniref:NAD(P)H-hydrate dehydratase n=1 Tax=Marivita sp. GX14005 TaxID=2942276 RepID=UPI0020191618|nr:NAD(P)H-hydrate dehydratase [Marivita sp. GX14005]MCL3883466.1 NAD(P)H-hydrate dehydratase [Marivita sp. GX14005]